ncbi:MAG: response regulator [Ferruginibacter sp.]
MHLPLNILLIDDDNINNFLTKELFSLHNCDIKISAAQSVPEALYHLNNTIFSKERLPDVILLDINMPVTEGWEFIEAFEKLDPIFTGHVDLYIYTSSEYHKDIERAKSYASVKQILLKPISAEMIEEICKVNGQ